MGHERERERERMRDERASLHKLNHVLQSIDVVTFAINTSVVGSGQWVTGDWRYPERERERMRDERASLHKLNRVLQRFVVVTFAINTS